VRSVHRRFRLGARRTLAVLLVGAAALCAAPARAQAPAAHIELVVPTAAQGSTDLLARLVADGLARRGFGEVRVRNLPGRSGTIAATQVAAAVPDGRTLLVATPSSHGIASAFEARLPYDPVASFTPILRFAAAPYLLVVRPGGPSTLAQFVEQARAAKEPWRYASTGAGGPHHLVAEYYFQRAGLKLQHVPLAGGAAALARLGEGGVEVMLPAAVLALPQVKAGQLKALAVTGSRRLQALPDVPTFAEAGIAVDVESWYGLMAPAGLPAAEAQRLAGAVRATLGEPAVQARLAELATQPTTETGDDFARLVAAEVVRWQALVRELGIQVGSKGD
jgi:tripartite-type tricarboxylate transporter receptor subunit TctC